MHGVSLYTVDSVPTDTWVLLQFSSLAVKIQCVLIDFFAHNIDVLKCKLGQLKDVCLSAGAKLLPQENQPWRQLDSHGGCWGLEQQNTAGNKEAWQLHAC